MLIVFFFIKDHLKIVTSPLMLVFNPYFKLHGLTQERTLTQSNNEVIAELFLQLLNSVWPAYFQLCILAFAETLDSQQITAHIK